MKRIILVVFIFIVFLSKVYSTNIKWQYTKEDSTKVVSLLNDFKNTKEVENIPYFFAYKFIGVPYVASTLEKNNEEKLVVNLQQLDCTTFVENVLALTLCVKNNKYSFYDFCKFLQQVRYEDGKISYPSRLHYFTEWIIDNEKQRFVKEIQTPNPPFTAKQLLNINYMSNNFFKYPMLVNHREWVEEIREMEEKVSGTTYFYIPKDFIANSSLFKNTIKNGDIIAIVTARKGLDTSHIGFASWKKDGLHLLNASKIRGSVVDEKLTLYNYMQTQRYQLGIRIIKIL